MSMPEWMKRLVGFDFETTGPEPMEDRIVTASAVAMEFRDGQTTPGIHTEEWLINPEREISEEAAKLHGITNEMVKEAGQSRESGVLEVYNTLWQLTIEDGYTLVAFNVTFDLTMLREEVLSLGKQWDKRIEQKIVDPFVLHKAIDPMFKRRTGLKENLESLCRHYRVEIDRAHTATDDVMATLRLLWKIVGDSKMLQMASIEELQKFQSEKYEKNARGLEEWFLKQPWYEKEKGDFNYTWPVYPERVSAV